MFDNSKLNYAQIFRKDGHVLVEGHCSEWTIPGNGPFVKLIIEGKEFLTSLENVILSEEGESNVG